MDLKYKGRYEEVSTKQWNEKIRKMTYKVLQHQKKWCLREEKPKFSFSGNDELSMKKIKHSLPMSKFFILWNSLEDEKRKAEFAERMLELETITPLFKDHVQLIISWSIKGVEAKIRFKKGFCVLKKTEGSFEERMNLTSEQRIEFQQEIEEMKFKNLFNDSQETLYQERILVDKIIERKTERLEKMVENLFEEGYKEIFELVKSELEATKQDRWSQINQN